MGKIRTALALAFVAASTAVLAATQVLVLKTGLGDPALAPRLWHRSILRALGLRVQVIGRPSPRWPLLIVANHVSWTDIAVIGSAVDVSFIAKAEMEGWPLLGWLSRLQRTVFVERERRHRSGDQAGEIARRLKAGDAMVLFAEGTTGDGTIVLPFKSTLFGAATMAVGQDAGDAVVIQPVAIAYTRRHGMPLGRAGRTPLSWIGDQDLAPHVAGLLKLGAIDVELRFGEPVVFSAGSNRKEAARLVEARVRDMVEDALRGAGPAHEAVRNRLSMTGETG